MNRNTEPLPQKIDFIHPIYGPKKVNNPKYDPYNWNSMTKFLPTDPDWPVLHHLNANKVIPRLANGRLWLPAYWEFYYMNDPGAQTRYRYAR